MPADQEMDEAGTSPTNSVTSSRFTLGNITVTEAFTVPEATDNESAEEDEDPSTGPNDNMEGTETSAKEVRIKAQKVTKDATKRKLCSTTYSHENQIEEYPDREEKMSAEQEQLREEKMTTKRSPVSLTRALSSRHHVA